VSAAEVGGDWRAFNRKQSEMLRLRRIERFFTSER
jgi:hypothetical protein